MSMTVAEKILARAAGLPSVKAGDVVEPKVEAFKIHVPGVSSYPVTCRVPLPSSWMELTLIGPTDNEVKLKSYVVAPMVNVHNGLTGRTGVSAKITGFGIDTA